MADCVFCGIIEGSASAERVYDDDHAVAFLDIKPITPGHTLVVPRRHTPDIWGLDEHEVGPLMIAVLRVARQVRAALAPDGLNVFQSNGAAAFQTVFHLHVHLLPRTAGDLPLPSVLQAAPGVPEELAAMAERIRKAGSGE